MSVPDDDGKTIVIRDRRKPNQYTTDNVLAREWLPILRVGDAFFFYSVYLSMANKETESSWGSLRTMAKYLQCGVDLIIRGNRLLEICELIHIAPGNQRTSNEYYILDPPSLTPELKERISRRLDDILAQETSKNWQAWAKQVRKALGRHRALPDIWAERRVRRGGRPVHTVRPEKGVRDSQAGFAEQGDCGSRTPCTWDTNADLVGHMRGVREPQPEQEQETRQIEQGQGKDQDASCLLVRERCRALEIAPQIVEVMLEKVPLPVLIQQLDWLPFRHARDTAAMLVSAVQGGWAQPSGYDQDEAAAIWAEWLGQDLASMPPEPLDAPVPTHGATSADDDASAIWAQVLQEMRLQMTRATFDTWLRGAHAIGVQGDTLIVRVRDTYAVDWLHSRWRVPIRRTLAGIVGQEMDVRFEV